MSDCDCGTEQAEKLERTTLTYLLIINGAMFLIEAVLGVIAQSTGLIADSLDMLADAAVYGISLYVVGKGITRQARAATLSGWLQIILGVGVLFDVVRRHFLGSEPQSILIMSVGLGALVANITCLLLISKHRNGGVHMRASWIFSTNDVIVNIGVIVSGALVWMLGSRYPDLLVGAVIATVVVRGGLKILQEARSSRQGEIGT
ncbi:cation transporter [uncultured Zhongshania sp.]|uniref:cation transporter n=1 Tax=uncultured Zhongshania sp. TaxID=1642288 RepID=UPI0030D8409B|tara:strand:- start:4416 stop:5027 length:612 start_codon:yes stop_codon:yes gene_type:complete